jgi:hypothetical protein
MLIHSQAKDDFVSTVARLGVAAATRRTVLATLIFSCTEPDVQFAFKGKRNAGTTLDAPSRIHNLKRAPLDQR